MTLNGERAFRTYLSNDGPRDGQETDWLETLMRPERLVYSIGVAPRGEDNRFNEAFTAILDSLRFKK